MHGFTLQNATGNTYHRHILCSLRISSFSPGTLRQLYDAGENRRCKVVAFLGLVCIRG